MTTTRGTDTGAGGHSEPPTWQVGPKDCLLVVDVQNDFCRGGRLEVADADAVVPLINLLSRRFVNVVLTQDWHTPGHASFASSHPGSAPFETLELPYGTQVLWPDHCVQGTQGAALHPRLNVPQAQLVLRKGFHPQMDSYSVFLEADRRTHTGLSGYLALRGIDRVFLAGLTTDFCVAWSALDARRFGFAAVVLEDACRAIDTQGSLASAWAAMTAAGVERGRCAQVQAEPMNSAPPM